LVDDALQRDRWHVGRRTADFQVRQVLAKSLGKLLDCAG
jgi:hypothetical protein